jgi:hypothetical protein
MRAAEPALADGAGRGDRSRTHLAVRTGWTGGMKFVRFNGTPIDAARAHGYGCSRLEEPMSAPHGPAQTELIRRYARAMRELQADALKARAPRAGAGRSAEDRATRQAAKRFTKLHRDVPASQ